MVEEEKAALINTLPEIEQTISYDSLLEKVGGFGRY